MNFSDDEVEVFIDIRGAVDDCSGDGLLVKTPSSLFHAPQKERPASPPLKEERSASQSQEESRFFMNETSQDGKIMISCAAAPSLMIASNVPRNLSVQVVDTGRYACSVETCPVAFDNL